MQDINYLLYRLSKSKFRSSFHLKEKDIEYIDKKGLDKIKDHAYDFINKRLRPNIIPNDGKQTPMRGHPVFIAEHATATCCRGCLNKWYGIPKNRELTDMEVDYIVKVIMTWITNEYKKRGINYEKAESKKTDSNAGIGPGSISVGICTIGKYFDGPCR